MKKYLAILVITFAFISNVAFSQDNVEKGINAVKRGDYVTALDLLKNAVKSSPKYDANCYYGIALYKTGSLDEAEKYFKIALKDDDEGIEALKGLGEVYTAKKKYSDADALFKKAVKLDPENIPVLISRAANYSAQDKIDEAIQALTLATSINKEKPDPNIFVGLGDAYNLRGSFKAAKDYYNRAIKINPNLASAYYGLGKADFKLKKYNEALVSFNTAISKDANFAEAYLEKGKILYFGDKIGDAADAFKKYSSLKPGSQEGNSYYAKTLYAQGKLDEALAMLNGVLKADPNSVTGNLYTAYIYSEKEQADSVAQVEQYQKALQFFSKVPLKEFEVEDLLKYAKVNVSLRNFSDAYPIFEKAIKLDSANSQIYYEYGKAYFKAEDYENSMKNFVIADNLGLNTLAFHIFKGFTNFYLKKYELALTDFQNAIKIDDKYILSYSWAAKCYIVMNKNEEAIKMFEEILKIDPDNAEAKDRIPRLKLNTNNGK